MTESGNFLNVANVVNIQFQCQFRLDFIYIVIRWERG